MVQPDTDRDSNSEGGSKYAPSVEAMNGCLFFLGKVFLMLILILLLPAIIPLLLFWWIVAWILGLIFPGKDFFPYQQMWDSSRKWCQEKLHIDLEEIVGAAVLVIVISLFASFIKGFFNNDK